MKLSFTLLLICLQFSSIAQDFISDKNLKLHKLSEPWPSEETLSFLDTEVSKYNFFSANEFHRSAMALKQKKAFIKYLSDNKGLDKLVIEFPYTYGYWINQFLSNGDTTLLRKVTNTQWAYDKFKENLEVSHDSYSFFTWLREFKLSKNINIEVVGIDLDQIHHASLGLWSVQQFLKKDQLKSIFENSNPDLDKLVEDETPNISKVEKWKEAFDKELSANDAKVKTILGTEYEHLKKILTSIDDDIAYESAGNKEEASVRENVLIRNFKREIAPTDIIYAQFGEGHLWLNEFHGMKNMMATINEDPKYKGLTLNIKVHCERCKLGESNTAYKPYKLRDDGGYWWHDWIVTLSEEDHDKLINALTSEPTVIDVRNAKENFSQLSELFQYIVVLF